MHGSRLYDIIERFIAAEQNDDGRRRHHDDDELVWRQPKLPRGMCTETPIYRINPEPISSPPRARTGRPPARSAALSAFAPRPPRARSCFKVHEPTTRAAQPARLGGLSSRRASEAASIVLASPPWRAWRGIGRPDRLSQDEGCFRRMQLSPISKASWGASSQMQKQKDQDLRQLLQN